jgi:hypothetical protein
VNAPTFKPDRNSQPSPSIGDLVSLVTSRGEEVVGKVASVSMGGTYKVVANGVEYFKQAKDLNPITTASPGEPVQDVPSQPVVQEPPAEKTGEITEPSEPRREALVQESPNYEKPSPFVPPKSSESIPGPPPIQKPFVPPKASESIPGPPPVQNSVIDSTQKALDGAGVVGDAVIPGAGVAADGTNAAISMVRAFTDKENRGEHVKNAGISLVSMIPFLGDIAKVGKYGAKATRGGSRGPASASVPAGEVQDNVLIGDLLGGNGPPVGDNPSPSSSGSGDGDDPLLKAKGNLLEFAGVTGKVIVATVTAANSISLMNKAAIEYHRDLTKYNGAIAEAYGKLEADRAGRSVREGSDLSGSLSGLVESQSRLEEKLQEFQSPWKVIGADIMRALAEMATIGIAIVDLLEPISEIYIQYIRPWLERMGLLKPGAQQTESTGFFERIQKRAAENAKKPRKL